MGARGKREAFSKRLWKTPLHVCTCSQPFPKRLSRPEFPAFSTIAAASIGHALQHKSDPPKRQENQKSEGCYEYPGEGQSPCDKPGLHDERARAAVTVNPSEP